MLRSLNVLASAPASIHTSIARFGVSYPTNGVKECYTKALEDRGLTDACFSSSSQKAFSLGGMYRRYVQRHLFFAVSYRVSRCETLNQRISIV